MSRPSTGRRVDVRRGDIYDDGASYMGPNQGTLLYDWTPTLDNVTFNGGDAVSVLCRNRFYASVAGLEMTQPVGARQALWNATDADLGNQPTLEFAGAEQYQTASSLVLPTACTLVVVAKDELAGAFGSLFEHSTFYSAADGGFALYSSANASAGLHFTGQTVKASVVPGSGKLGYCVSFDLAQSGSAAVSPARLNNAALGATGFNASAIGTFRSTPLMLGGRAASTFWIGPWARARIYNGVFTSDQADAEYAFQKARFGLP